MQRSAAQVAGWRAGGLAGSSRQAPHASASPMGSWHRRAAGHNGRDGVKPTSDRGRLAGSTLHRPASALCQMTSCCSSREGRKREGGGKACAPGGRRTPLCLLILYISERVRGCCLLLAPVALAGPSIAPRSRALWQSGWLSGVNRRPAGKNGVADGGPGGGTWGHPTAPSGNGSSCRADERTTWAVGCKTARRSYMYGVRSM